MTLTTYYVRTDTDQTLALRSGQEQEFEIIIDTLGRIWNSLLHPRDRYGRFIRTFSNVIFSPRSRSKRAPTFRGDVIGFDRDTGAARVKVTQVDEGFGRGLKPGDYVQVPQTDLAVQKIKARRANATINSGPAKQVRNAIASLRRQGYDEQAEQVREAYQLALRKRVDKTPAIDAFREVSEFLDTERSKGKNYKFGDDVDDIRDPEERRRVRQLDQVIATLATARHDLGDKILPFQNEKGTVTGNQPQIREQAAKADLIDAAQRGARYLDLTEGDGEWKQFEEVSAEAARDEVYARETETVLPELARNAYQRVRTGLSRLSGARQAQFVAPADRWHTDKNGDAVVVGSVVNVDAGSRGGSERPEFTGVVTRIHTGKNGDKTVYVREFSPDYEKGYKDWRAKSSALEIADDETQSERFQQLALQNVGATSLVNNFTQDYVDAMKRRLSSKDAKRISGGFFDIVPIDERVRADRNGQGIRIGDWVADPDGALGVVAYIEPNSQTIRVQYPNGQEAARRGAKNFTKVHTANDPVYLDDVYFGNGGFVPTREEAAQAAESLGADSVAEVIRNGGDDVAIKDAMVTDPAFREALTDVDELFTERDKALRAGEEPSADLKERVAPWDLLTSASAGQFREEDETPENASLPTPPQAIPEVENPRSPSNPDTSVTPDGTRVDGEGEPIEPGDILEGVDEEEEEGVSTPDVGTPTNLATKIVGDLSRMVDGLDNGGAKNLAANIVNRLAQAAAEGNYEEFDRALADLTRAVNGPQFRADFEGTILDRFVNNLNGRPLRQYARDKRDTLFEDFEQREVQERPDDTVVPEDVSPAADDLDNTASEDLLNGEPVYFDEDGEELGFGFSVLDPNTVETYDGQPTDEDIQNYLEDNPLEGVQGISIWQGQDGRWRIGVVELPDDEEEANSLAQSLGANQFVNIETGEVFNTSLPELDGRLNEPVRDDRSNERALRKAGEGTVQVQGSTNRQRAVASALNERDDVDDNAKVALDAISSGEGEVNGEQALALGEYVNGIDTSEFDGADARQKAASKGTVLRLADRMAEETGATGVRQFASRNTALRRASDVTNQTNAAASAASEDNGDIVDDIRTQLEAARQAIKDDDNRGAASIYRRVALLVADLAIDRPEIEGRLNNVADRLDGGLPESEEDTDTTPDGDEEPATPDEPSGSTPAPSSPRVAKSYREVLRESSPNLPERIARPQTQPTVTEDWSSDADGRTREERIAALEPFAEFGETYIRGVADNLNTARRMYAEGRDEEGDRWLGEAEKVLARTLFEEPTGDTGGDAGGDAGGGEAPAVAGGGFGSGSVSVTLKDGHYILMNAPEAVG